MSSSYCSPDTHALYDAPDPWAQFSLPTHGFQFPSEYIIRHENRTPTNSTTLYGHYNPGTSYTAPLPQGQPPFLHSQYRPKSMSWPRGFFSTKAKEVYPTHHASAPLAGYYPSGQSPQHDSNSFVDTGTASVGASHVNGERESLSPYFGPLCDSYAAQSPETYADYPNTMDNTPQSSLHSLSYNSTPVPPFATLSPMPTQGSLLGLAFSTDDAEASPLRQDPAAKRPKLALKRSDFRPRKRSGVVAEGREQKKFVCDRCGHTFDRKCNLTQHGKVHGIGKRCVPCHIDGCDKVYGRQAELNRHIKSFHDKDTVTCDHCHKSFVRFDSLVRHNVDKCRVLREEERQEMQRRATNTTPLLLPGGCSLFHGSTPPSSVGHVKQEGEDDHTRIDNLQVL